MSREMKPMRLIGLIGLVCLTGCDPQPVLHLYDEDTPEIIIPRPQMQLDVIWDVEYQTNFGFDVNWRMDWFYGMSIEGKAGWDDEDMRIFGALEPATPTSFHVRRYFTGDVPYGKRIKKYDEYLKNTTSLRRFFEQGYWDILAWNDIQTLDPIDPVQSLHFEEPADYNEPITAYTNQSMNRARYYAPKYQNAFYQPEQLYSVCALSEEINYETLEGFVYNEEENIWVKQLAVTMEPITYMYLPQIILLHNNGRINYVAGTANLSGMARSTNLNTGIAGSDPVAVNFYVRLKTDRTVELEDENGEKVKMQADIVGGRLMTFGMCGQNGNRVTRVEDNVDTEHHYIDVTMQFSNGMDSTFYFPVTEQVRRRPKGGVITYVLDMDTVPTPRRAGGSGFNAVVKEIEDGGTWEFEM